MILYIIKTILCSGLLLAFYFAFLQKEKIFHFNRWYLLFSIIFSLAVPLIPISIERSLPVVQNDEGYIIEQIPQIITSESTKPISNDISFWKISAALYIFVSFSLLIRFIKNILTLVLIIRRSLKVTFQNSTLVLLNKRMVPYSFLHYIFIDIVAYKSDKIEKEILQHEITHVQQKHSIDIILLEFLMVFLWFNPFLFFYKKVVQLNHEFLADDAVIRKYDDSQNYQQLLLGAITNPYTSILSSSFNFLITKKRFIMMTRSTSPTIAILKQVAMLPLLFSLVFLFGTKTLLSQEKKKEEKTTPDKKIEAIKQPVVSLPTIGFTKEGTTQELLNEYNAIIEKYKEPNVNLTETLYKNITDEDRERLKTIFLQMSKEQQSKQVVGFAKSFGPLKKSAPTSAQLQLWKNAKIYGVWINNKRVGNAELNNYSNSDFAHMFISKLSKNAINYGKHYYQVDLMTNEFYEEYYKKALANKNNQMYIRHINQ